MSARAAREHRKVMLAKVRRRTFRWLGPGLGEGDAREGEEEDL